MTLIIGLTGGIGSGKSTVAKMFQEYNIPVYFSDDEAKKLIVKSKIIRRKLIARFGEKTYLKNKLNRVYIASIVFNSKEDLNYLNSVVHPKVNEHFRRWVKKQKTHYILQENAILFESGSDKFCDYIIAVTAPTAIKVKRVIVRDNSTEKKVISIIENQMSDSEKILKADFAIKNIDLQDTKLQVEKIHKQILKLNT